MIKFYIALKVYVQFYKGKSSQSEIAYFLSFPHRSSVSDDIDYRTPKSTKNPLKINKIEAKPDPTTTKRKSPNKIGPIGISSSCFFRF